MENTLISKNIKVEKQTIIGDNFQIQIISSQIIRLLYQENGIIEKSASLIQPSLNLERVEFHLSTKDDWLMIETADVILHYLCGSPFSYNTLYFLLKKNNRKVHFGTVELYTFGGLKENKNLLGESFLEKGLFSFNNFTLYDNSFNPIYRNNILKEKLYPYSDYYLFFFDNYLTGLEQFYRLSLPNEIIPACYFGPIIHLSAFKEEEIISEIDNLWTHNLRPSLIINNTYFRYGQENGEIETFDQARKILQDHGVAFFLNAYPLSTFNYSLDDDNTADYPSDYDNPFLLKAYENALKNYSFPWGIDASYFLDTSKERQNGSAAIINLYQRHGQKQLLPFGNYYGLGSHKYQITRRVVDVISWEELRKQMLTIINATNVGVSYYSPDIGGTLGLDSPELYLRWLALGVVSPIFRIISNRNIFPIYLPNRRNNEEILRISQRFFALRKELQTYLYNTAIISCLKKLTIARPLYFYHSNPKNSNESYYLGDSLLVAPVVTPSENAVDMAIKGFYLPSGIWYDYFTLEMLRGPKTIKRLVKKDEIIILAKKGAIVPTLAEGNLYAFTIFPESNEELVLYPESANLKKNIKVITATTKCTMKIELSFSAVPLSEEVQILLAGIVTILKVKVTDGKLISQDLTERGLLIKLAPSSSTMTLTANGSRLLKTPIDLKQRIINLLTDGDFLVEDKNKVLYQLLLDPLLSNKKNLRKALNNLEISFKLKRLLRIVIN